MIGHEKAGIKIQCSQEDTAAGKVSIIDGFVNSKNPEKQKFLDYIAQEAAENKDAEQTLVDAIYDSWGVNGANTFNVIGFESFMQNYSK